jgi:hypothetical protein
MLGGLAPLAHLLRVLVEPALHGLENMLMLPTGDPRFSSGGTWYTDSVRKVLASGP